MSETKRRIMKRIAAILIATLSLTTAVAQDELLEEQAEEEIRRYTVEVIVFSYEEDVSVGTEVFLPDEPPIEEDLLTNEDADIIEQAASVNDALTSEEEEPELAERELELVLLTEEEFMLGDAARQFELLDAYKTIMHVGWTQPTYPEEETSPIELRILGEPPDGLNGTFTLYLSRYLHFVVDLALDAADESDEAVEVDDSIFSFGDSRQWYDHSVETPTLPVRYLIQENRIFKNGDLRYFDHPKFGVLTKITRVEDDAEDEFGDDDLPDPLIRSSGQ